MTDERQKKTTEEYRNNWDSIFKKQVTKAIDQDNRNLTNKDKDNENTPRTTN